MSVMEVHSQTHLSFLGKNLPNNSYVDFGLVGHDSSGSDSVQCHTNFKQCCRPSLSNETVSGNWFFPNGDKLEFGMNNGIFQRREAKRVDIRTTGNISVTGIYCCDIPYTSSSREKLCVGLYNYAGITVKMSNIFIATDNIM